MQSKVPVKGFLGYSELGIWNDESVKLNVHTNSSVCKGIYPRTGLGKVLHIDVAFLWLQTCSRRENHDVENLGERSG